MSISLRVCKTCEKAFLHHGCRRLKSKSEICRVSTGIMLSCSYVLAPRCVLFIKLIVLLMELQEPPFCCVNMATASSIQHSASSMLCTDILICFENLMDAKSYFRSFLSKTRVSVLRRTSSVATISEYLVE